MKIRVEGSGRQTEDPARCHRELLIATVGKRVGAIDSKSRAIRYMNSTIQKMFGYHSLFLSINRNEY